MKVALQNAISLLRQSPRLWVPVIVATAVSFGVSLLLKVLTHRLILALIHGYSVGHSVLGHTPVRNYWHLTTLKILPFVLPINWFGQFLVICIFTFALVVTARKSLGITDALYPVSPDVFRPLLWFSVKVLVAYHLLALLTVAPLRLIPFRFLFPSALALGIVSQLLLALLVAPMAIRFLARVLHRHATESAIRSARMLAILTAILSIAIAYLAPRIEHPLFAFWPQMTQPAVQTILLAGNLLATLPYAVFFVSVALLLDEEALSESCAPALEPASDSAPSAL